MKQQRRKPTHHLILPLAIIVAVAAVIILLIVHPGHAPAPEEPQSVKVTEQPEFSFTGATDWRKGPVNKTSLALFHDTDGCFTSIEHKTGTIDVTAALNKNQSNFTGTGNTITAGAILTATLQTGSGKQSYQLHQFKITGGTGDNKLMEGLELGYLQLSGSYIVIQGHCDTADQLPATIPALQAIKFDD